MVVKVYVSGISGNKEVKKRQQRVLMILDSRNIKYDVIDIAEPGNEEQKDFMQINSTSLGATVGDANPRHALPPQLFNDTVYCGDYDQFDMSNEIDELEKFLKLAPDDAAPTVTSNAEIQFGNGNVEAEDSSKDVANDVKAKELSPPAENVVENEISAETEKRSAETEKTNEPEDAEKTAPTSTEETNGSARLDNEEGGEKTAAVTEES